MTLKSLFPRPWLTLALVALILFTRINYSSAIVDPPDATLGVFFIAGMFIPSSFAFALLFGAAALADQVSFMLGVSDWCFTAAYVFLVPTYASLWYAGYLCRKSDLFRAIDLAKIAIALVVACAAAYFISSQSFFMLSGRYPPTLSTIDYWSRIMKWFPRYIGWACAYTAAGLVIAIAAKQIRGEARSKSLKQK